MKVKYDLIYKDIVQKINSGVYKKNSFIPSESKFMDKYNVSRDTVRKSLAILEKEGYIQKIKGKGSIVLDVQRYDFSVSRIHTFKEVSKSFNNDVRTIVKSLSLITPNERIRKELSLDSERRVWEVIRVREISNEKIILDKDYLCFKNVPKLSKEVCEDSIYEYLENVLNLKIAYAKKEIIAEKVNDFDKECLDIQDYNMIIVVKNHTYLDDTTLFHYTESRHRPDKFSFVHFARRYN